MQGSSTGMIPNAGFSGNPATKEEVIKYQFQTRKNQLINLKLMEKHLPHELFTIEDIKKES